MKPQYVGSILALALSLPAQEQPSGGAGDDLPQLRKMFAWAGGATIAIAVRDGRPAVVLQAGTDAGGEALSPRSLVPLQAMAKLVAADAIWVQCKGKVEAASGVQLGERELAVRELLAGTQLLPDYYVLDGSNDAADAAVLRACGDMAVSAGLQLRATPLGAAEFVLAESLAFAGRYRDWSSMLRATLAPHVYGFDPVSAGSLDAAQRARLAFGSEDLSNLAAARPELLRTVLTVKDLTGWWQWRLQQLAPLYCSSRMGTLGRCVTNAGAGEQRWQFTARGRDFTLHAIQYPAQRAGILWLAGAGTAPAADLNLAKVGIGFEMDVFAEPGTDDALPRPPVLGSEVTTPVTGVSRVDVLGGTRWSGVPAGTGVPVTIAFDAGARSPMSLGLGPDVTTFATVRRTGTGFTAVARTEGVERSVWMLPRADGGGSALGVVLVTRRYGAMTNAAADPTGSSVPQYLALVADWK